MLNINRKLAELAKDGGSIKVGLVGAGQMGRGLISQIESMKGMRVVATADIAPENAVNAYKKAGVRDIDIYETEDNDKADQSINRGSVVVTKDASLIASLKEVDVIVDATGVPTIGAKMAWDGIMNQKHVVMLNAEADVTVGPLLSKMARAAGLVYTGTAGDEPGCIMELHDFADALGFEIVALGKGKNNQVNYFANPDTAREEALQKGASPKMITSFQDGTKTMVEMTCVANATGFIPDVPGMHGVKSEVRELPDIFRLQEHGGILHQHKIVEYVDGIAPGVFAIITSDKEEVHHEMRYLKMGNGPHYVLYRPYHLCSLETPLSVAKAYLDQEPTIIPYYGSVAETVAVAKKDLLPGDALDCIGGFTAFGRIVTATDKQRMNALPIGLIGPHIRLKRNVKQGDYITYDDVEFMEENIILHLRRMMDAQM
ncbi:NAD(P)H-dependent oxidoreductase [Brevibacillus halotolerans]|uniref:NAD(P)H-dependent oxidoreductase n=1 Tax=Brevibacillus halotolerans TaxID=1507437 RepID=UPI001BB3F2E8|nr:NAD(P)-dependent oxidoreductase [Brevibacillus halotolerans]